MIELTYSLVIEATEEPDSFGFYSPDLEGFAGIGHSIEDCLYKAKWGMRNTSNCCANRDFPSRHPIPTPELPFRMPEWSLWHDAAVFGRFGYALVFWISFKSFL